MCMKNRFDTFGKYASRALCLMSLCGLVWACKDEYTLDDEKPSWLSQSIYSYLEQEGKYQTYLRLVNDPDLNPANAAPLREELGRTGSRTVFVTDDAAWQDFFSNNAKLPETNPWHGATSYERLSPTQKKLLYKGSQFTNAMVTENLASEEGTSSRGKYMRRFTLIESTDSIDFMPSDQIPYTFNNSDKNYWRERHRTNNPANGDKGLFIIKDATRNMLNFFTEEYMGNNGISDDDFRKFTGRVHQTGAVFVSDAAIKEKDEPCENGYVNVSEKVLRPLPNMAEAIRTSGRTKIFSHMLDRFSYPKYLPIETDNYRKLHPEFKENDSIFALKYFAYLHWEEKLLESDNLGVVLRETDAPYGLSSPALYGEEAITDETGNKYGLKYDPGWNELRDANATQTDMAAMFIPSDDALWDYFSATGGGDQLIKAYSTLQDIPITKGTTKEAYDNLFKQIDAIPLSTLQALINVMMFPSFASAVPSKMTTLRNDAHEEMFDPSDAELVKDGGHIDTCIIACNGAVYIMDKVFAPADYSSVASPAYISPLKAPNNIMKWAIYDQNYLHMNYYAYLKAMKSHFTFFLPSDEALTRYYDPVSFTSSHPRVIRMEMKGNSINTQPKLHKYHPETGEIEDDTWRTDKFNQYELYNRLKDVLESHTIVMEKDKNNPITKEKNEYYLTKNGSAVKITREGDKITKVQGGYQLENERKNKYNGGAIPDANGLLHISTENMKDLSRDGNGVTFIIDDSPIIPASKSVYGLINDGNGGYARGEFADNHDMFFQLTDFEKTYALNDKITINGILTACGLDATKMLVWLDGKASGSGSGGVDMNVNFFQNYNYTVFVPTDAAVQQTIDNQNLPTWDDIMDDYYASVLFDEDGNEVKYKDPATGKDKVTWKNKDYEHAYEVPSMDSIRIVTKIQVLNNFIRTHFVDNSVFVDQEPMSEQEYLTSSYDNKLGTFVRIHMRRTNNGTPKLEVRDYYHPTGWKEVTSDENGLRNIMARDMVCILESTPGSYSGKTTTPTGRSTMNNMVIMSSSFAVVHEINGTLSHAELEDNNYANLWKDYASCKRYLNRYAIR